MPNVSSSEKDDEEEGSEIEDEARNSTLERDDTNKVDLNDYNPPSRYGSMNF